MDKFKWIFSLALLGSIFVTGNAQLTWTLATANTGPMEGKDDILITVSEGTMTPAVEDITITFTLDSSSTAVEGYDFETITHTIVILAGSNTGSTTIRIIDDCVKETTGETVVLNAVISATAASDTLAGVPLTFTIADTPDTEPVYATFDSSSYWSEEGVTNLTVTGTFRDCNGKVTVLNEGSVMINLQEITGSNIYVSTAEVTNDYLTFAAISPMPKDKTFEILVEVVDDIDVEPLDVSFVKFDVTSGMMDTAASLTTPTATLFIIDNEFPDNVVMTTSTYHKRRRPAILDFTSLSNYAGAIKALVWENVDKQRVRDQKCNRVTHVTTFATPLARRCEIPMVQKKNRRIYGPKDFKFSYTLNGQRFTDDIFVPVDPESEVLENTVGQTQYLFPLAAKSPDLERCIDIGVKPIVNRRGIKWEKDFNDVPKGRGKNAIKICEVNDAGIYSIFRKGRGNRDWRQTINVVVNECPRGTFNNDTTGECNGVLSCYNGGIVHATFGFCICTAGFKGRQCQIPTGKGSFGQNYPYTIDGTNAPGKKIDLPASGKGVEICSTYGCHCASGWFGQHCDEACRIGYYGSDCLYTANCVDDLADRFTGECTNGCRQGFSGPGLTCQN